MEAHNLPEALNLIMEQRGCSGSQLARDLGVSQQWVSDVSRGKQDTPTEKAIRLLASVGWELVIRPKREEEDPVNRREFVTATASVMFVPSPNVGPHEDPLYLGELARRVGRARYEHGGGAVATTAIKHIRRIEPLIASNDRKLQEQASNLAIEAAWTLNDARRFDAGEKVGGLALALARRSGSMDAQSRAYSALANMNAERGERDRSFKFAEAGGKLREIPDAQQQWMRLRKAWAQAHLRGQENVARDEIENVLGLLRDNGGFTGQSPLDMADMTSSLGRAMADLGAHEEAQEIMNQALSFFENHHLTPVALCLAHQSTTALSASQVDLAANRMLMLARFTPLINSPRVDGHVKTILTMSARWGTVPDMRDARDQLKGVIHSTVRTSIQ